MADSPLLAQIREVFDRWLYLPNYHLIDAVGATVIANRLEGDPLWLVLVGPSGSGKSEIVTALAGNEAVELLSSFTPRTLLSGLKGGSLLDRMTGRPWLLVMKDFTTIFSLQRDEKKAILGQLREIYDGRLDKAWGLGGSSSGEQRKTWQGKLGLITCFTDSWDEEISQFRSLGERFLVWRLAASNPKLLGLRSIVNKIRATEMRRELRAAMKLLDQVDLHFAAEVPMADTIWLSELAAFLAQLRGHVPRDPYRHEPTGPPLVEATGRISGQLYQFLRGLMVLRQVTEPGVEEMLMVERLAFGSVPLVRLKLLLALAPDCSTVNELIVAMNLSRSLVYRVVQDLVMLEILHHEGAVYSPAQEIQRQLQGLREVGKGLTG